ncbi:hypothetical protein SNE40_012593 [Patella caerulea]|uniref:Fucosyltransferase n=1 Tax=Patella caerulea TaxID=87958 RepID=A0AAN8Q1N1_PATCE
MKSNTALFIILMVITGATVFTVFHTALVIQHLYTYGSRLLDVDRKMSQPMDPLTTKIVRMLRPVTKISPKNAGKATTVTRTTATREATTVIRTATKSNMAPEDGNTTAYKEIALINTPGWYSTSIPLENVFLNCDINNCRVRNGWDHFNTSDAAVFYDVDLPLKTPPKRIKQDQIWVVSGWESPHHTRSQVFSNPGWRNQINWTMTYRLDSDIPVPYGLVTKSENMSNKNYSAIMNNKTKLVAWVVSNCNTPGKRWKYVQQLKEIVPVDVFGKCSSSNPGDVFGMINKTYKFYLSFENSLCKDYITEKFFRRQKLDVVLITRGVGNYSKFYPQESFINSNNFKNAHELGKFLLKLDKNNTAYVNYLKSKENYRSEDLNASIIKGLCDMCKMLQNTKFHQNIYTDFNKWWLNSDCTTEPTDII